MKNKEEGRMRKKEIRVKVTDNEWEFAKDKSKYCCMSISNMIRTFIMEGVIIKYDAIGIKELSKEINKVGTNINQIARWVNEKGGEYDRQDIDNLIREFQRLQADIYARIWGIR